MKWAAHVAVALAAGLVLAGCSSRSARPQTSLEEPEMRVAVQLAPTPRELLAPLRVGDEIEYHVSDKFTGKRHKAILRVDRVDASQVVFNQGARIERPGGDLIEVGEILVGDLDAMAPPGGWGYDDMTPGLTWSTRHFGNGAAAHMDYKLKAEVGESTNLHTPMGVIPVTLIEYWGWVTDKSRNISTPSKVSVQVWYSPQLRRVIRMETNVKAATNLVVRTYESSRELIELVAIRRR